MERHDGCWVAGISEYLKRSAEVKRRTAEACAGDIAYAAALLVECLSAGGKVLLCGNGGSAADAQHMAAEFVSLLRKDFARPALAAIALTTDTSVLTAYANDFNFQGIFARQVEALGRPGDVLIAISTSGNSPNVVEAIRRARELGLGTIALTGGMGGKVSSLADAVVCVPASEVQHIQEAHIAIEHILIQLTEETIFSMSSPNQKKEE